MRTKHKYRSSISGLLNKSGVSRTVGRFIRKRSLCFLHPYTFINALRNIETKRQSHVMDERIEEMLYMRQCRQGSQICHGILKSDDSL